ncbi:MAG: hypothetical protein ACYSUX_00320 [Planctomycetota bacterium]
MRRALKNHREVAHVWASQSQDRGYCNNMTFYGPTIYSYGHWAMATFYKPDIVLYKDQSYSNSTSHHQSYTRCAIGQHIKVLYLDYISHESPDFVEKNLAYFAYHIQETAELFARARQHAQCRLSANIKYQADLKYFCKLFKVKHPKKNNYYLSLDSEKTQAKIAKVKASLLKAQRKAKEKKNLAYSEIKAQLDQMEVNWLTKHAHQQGIPYKGYYFSFSETRCRISKDGTDIETSLGARVPIKEARTLYKALMRGDDVRTLKVGHYTVLGFNGTLRIGCHEITRNEIDRLAKVAGWSA